MSALRPRWPIATGCWQNSGNDVLADHSGEGVVAEMLDYLIAHLGDAYQQRGDYIRRPDGVKVALDDDIPLAVAGRLVQQDLCILERQGEEYLLTGGALCFPASWSLHEKMGRNLVAIHAPIPAYSDDIAKRVGRLFAAIQPGRFLWRANYLLYESPDLFQPRRTQARRNPGQEYIRVERQVLTKLPKTGAVIFGIHSLVLPARPDWVEAILAARGGAELGARAADE